VNEFGIQIETVNMPEVQAKKSKNRSITNANIEETKINFFDYKRYEE